MSFDWSDYLDYAQETFNYRKSSYTEARLRSAISRAYYAAFITTRNYLLNEGIKISYGQNPHLFVIAYFNRSSDRTFNRIGKDLNLIRLYRNSADYDNNVKDLQRKAKETLSNARSIITKINSL